MCLENFEKNNPEVIFKKGKTVFSKNMGAGRNIFNLVIEAGPK